MLSCLAALAEGYSTLELVMNIEHEEVVVKDVSDDELEMAAGGTQGGPTNSSRRAQPCC